MNQSLTITIPAANGNIAGIFRLTARYRVFRCTALDGEFYVRARNTDQDTLINAVNGGFGSSTSPEVTELICSNRSAVAVNADIYIGDDDISAIQQSLIVVPQQTQDAETYIVPNSFAINDGLYHLISDGTNAGNRRRFLIIDGVNLTTNPSTGVSQKFFISPDRVNDIFSITNANPPITVYTDAKLYVRMSNSNLGAATFLCGEFFYSPT